jgi:hypothetical protein
LHEQERHDEPVEHLRNGVVLQTSGHAFPSIDVGSKSSSRDADVARLRRRFIRVAEIA